METEKTIIAYTQWDRWRSYDMIKHMITTDIILK